MSAVPGNPLKRPRRAPASPLRTGSILHRSISLLLSFLLSTAFISLPPLVSPPVAMATPNVGMTVSAANPLLGGQVGYDITVTNSGDTKAYDLSIAGAFGSIPSTNGASVSYVSASDNLAPTSRTATGVAFVNIRDLAPGESYTLHLVMKLSATNWSVGDTVTGVFTSTSLDLPADVPGANTQTTVVNKNVTVIPIAIVSKTANQSTAGDQATGTQDRTYTYTIDVQNNFTDPTANVVITDTIDDGIQYQGMVSGSSPATVTRNAVTGKTVLVWNLGTMAAGQRTVLKYGTGIRYDFYGTANGGLNTSDTAAIPTTRTVPIPDKKSLSNTADLTGIYTDPRTLRVTPVSTSDTAAVSAAYFTGGKGQTVHGGGGPGSEVDYSLTYCTSQYYAVAATASILVTDTLPDGLTYKPGSSVPAPLSVTHHGDGTTDIVWVRPPIAASSSAGIAFTAIVDTTYEAAALAGQPVRSGDGFTNHVTFDTVWDDLVNDGRANNRTVTTASSASASFTEPLPSVLKQVWDPKASAWSKAATVTVGDVMHYRVSFNTNGNRVPLLTTVPMGSIDLTDWLPMGTSLVPGSIVTTFSPGAFSAVAGKTPNPSIPTTLSAGGIAGEEWWLGDVEMAGWWQAEFDVIVNVDPAVIGGVRTNNMWKMTGTNSYGKNYSDRDLVDLAYGEPLLTITKTPQSPLAAPGVGMPYVVTLSNAAGTSPARGLKLTDQLPAGMRVTAPTLDSVASFDPSTGTTSAVAVSSFDASYDAGLGVWTVTPKAGESISVPVGGRLTFGLTATPDTTAGAGIVLPNTVTANYATQDDTTTARAYAPVTANASVSLPGLSTLSKTGAPAALTLGDIATYTVTVSVPAGQIAYWPRIVDDLAIGGADYIAGSASLAWVGGTPVTAAAFNSGSTPTTSSPTNTSSRLIWQLANPIDNRGQVADYVFALTFAVRVTGTDHVGAREFWPMPANKNVAFINTARTDWNSLAVAGPGTPDFSTSNRTASINAQQPWITVTKTVTNGASFLGNSPVNFTVVGTNAGSWPAKKLTFTDYLPVGMRNTAPTVTAVRVGGSVLAPANYTVQSYDAGTGQISIDFASGVALAVNATMGVDVAATTDVAPLAGSSFVNTASVGFNTQADGSGRDYPRTPSVAANTGTASVAITSPTTVKSIISSTTAGIGDVVTYRLRVTVPAYTKVQNPTVVDTVQNTGMAMVAGSASLTDVSGSPTVPAALNPLTQVTTVGLATTFSMNSLDASRIIDNSLSAAPYVFDVTYTMNVTGLNGATWVWFAKGATAPSNNKIAFTWLANTGVKTTNGSNVLLTVKWPNLTVTKVSNVPTAAAGQTVTYTVTVRNDGTFPAYAAASGPSMVDTLPAGIDPATVVLSSVQRSWPSTNTLAAGTDYTSAIVGSQLQVTYTQPANTSTVVPVGGALTFKYSGTLKPDVGAGAQLINTAAAFWSSEPTAAPYARTYNGTNANQPAGWKASVTVGVPNTALLKSFTSSGVTTYTIGQQVPYTIVAGIPLNTTAYNTVMTDFVPKGLTVTTASVSPSGLGTLTVGAKSGVDGRTPITWTVGTVQNPSTALLTLNVTSTVDTTYFPSGGNVTAGQSIVNTAAVAWKDQASGGTTVTTVSNALPLTVVEPQLTITKSLATPITPGRAWAGQTVTYTVDVTNGTTNASPAYGLVLHDLLPANLFRPVDGSPRFVSVTLNGVPLNEFTDYGVDFGANPVTILTDPLLAIPAGGVFRLTYTVTLPAGPATTEGATWTNTATADSWTGLPFGGKTYGPASRTASLITQAPILALTKTVTSDAWLQWGRVASYRVTLTNTGSAPASTVSFTDQLSSVDLSLVPGSALATWPSGSSTPAGIWNPVSRTIDWSSIPATLTAGQSMTLVWSMNVENSAPLGTQDDTVTAGGLDPAGGPVTSPPAHAFVTVTDPRVQAVKILHAGQNANVPLGETVTYDLSALNTGNTTLSTVPLQDTFDSTRLAFVSASVGPDSQLPLGTLTWNNRAGAGIAPGARAATVTVTFRAIATGTSVPDTATIAGALDNHGSPVATSTVTEYSLRTTRPSVTLTKVLQGPTLVPVGTKPTYVLSLLNSGDTTLTTLILVDIFGSGRVLYDSATLTPTSTLPNDRVIWANALTAPLAPGAVTTIGLTLSSYATGNVINALHFVAGTDEFGGAVPATTTGDATLNIGRPTLATLSKAASVTTATAGQVVTYTVQATNTGNTPAYDVFLTDTLPAAFFTANSNPQLVSVKVDGTTIPGTAYSWSNAANPVTLDLSGGTGTAIPAGSTLTYTYLVTVPAGVADGVNQTNTASVPSYGSLPTGGLFWAGPSGTATVRTVAPVLTETKSVVGDVWLQAGGTVSYRLVVHNGGGGPAAGIQTTDQLSSAWMGTPTNVQATWPGGSATLSAALNPVTHLVTFGVVPGVLNPGQDLTLTWDQSLLAGTPTGSQDDTATTTGTDPLGAVVTAPVSHAAITVTDPHVAVAKALHPGQPAYVALGATVAYDFSVRNTGDTTLTTVPFTDAYDASRLAYVSGTPDTTSAGLLTWNNVAGAGLAPGAKTATFTATFRATATGLSIADTATVSGARDIHTDVAATAVATAVVSLTNPGASITKTLLSATPAPVGSQVTYRLDMRNTGDTALAVLPLADTFDNAHLTFATATVAPYSTDATAVVWANGLSAHGPLAPGDTASIDVTFDTVATGDAVLNRSALAVGTDANGTSVSATSTANSLLDIGRPVLTIAKSTEATSAEAGQPVTYTVTVTNSGTTPAYDLVLTDLLPPDMALAGPIAVTLNGVDLLPSQYSLDLGNTPLVFRTDGPGGASVPAGGSLTLVYQAALNAGVANGVTQTNTATVDSYRSLPGGTFTWSGPSASASVISRAPVLVLTKAVTGRTVIQPGDTTSYRMTVINTGDAPARQLAFADRLSSADMSPLGLATLTMPGGGTSLIAPFLVPSVFRMFWWSTETLYPGQTATLDWTMSADPLVAASTQSDTGIAGGFDNTGSEIDSNFDNASIKVTIPQIIVTKTLVGPAIVPVADFVAYDITVTNIGSTAVPSVPVTDTYDAARLAPTAQNPTANRSGGGILAWNDVTGGEGLAPGNSVTVRATFATLATGASIADTATVAGLTDEDGSPIPSSEATNAELSIGRPELTITKAAGVATAVAGQVVTYTIAITNAGSTPAYHVRLNDTFDPALPPVLDTVTLDGVPAAHNTGIFGDVLYVGFDATPIPAGSTVVVAYHTTVPSGLRDLTELPNNAHVTSYTSVPGGGATYDGPSTDATVTALSPVLEAVKSVEGGTHPVAGEVVHYRLDVTNTGHAPASTLMVSDVLSDGDMNPVAAGTVTWPDASQTTMGGSGVLGLWTIGPVPGTLLPGQTAIVRWDMRVAADATPGAKTDTATASSEDPAGGAVQSNPSPASVLVTRPGLSVHKVLLTPANGHAQLGSTVTYGVTVTNTGDTTLTAVPLSDSYDAARLTFASAGLHTDTASLGTLGWTNVLPLGGTLAPGATTDTLTVSFTANSTGTAVNTATVSGATDLWGHVPADAIDRNEELTVTRPHVAVTKELSSGQEHYVPRGQIVSYDITVTNDGDTSLVTLPLTDTYDASRMVPVSAVPATDAAGAGALSWTDLLSGGPALAPGDHRSVTVTFRTIASGSLVDTAAVIGATDTWGGTAPDASAVNAVATGTNPRVDLSKVLAPGQNRLVAVGDTVTYAFRVTNTGDTTLTTVPLSDAYQASQMAFVSATPDGATAAAGLVSWPDATAGSGLAPGETTTATATFRVLIAAAALDDTATVNGTDVFGMAVLPEGSSNGVAGAYAPGDLTLVKTADPASGSVVATGSLIHYTLTYLNSSPATVTAGVVSDTLVPALIYVPDSIALNGSPVADAAAWDAGSSSLSVALPPVGPGELGTVTFTARVAPWALSRRGILNSASWSDGGSVVATAEPTVHNVDPLDVVKTVRDVSGKGKVRTGDVLEWTIQIVNHGVVPATGVRMTDDVPRGTTYVKGSITGPGASSVGNPHLSWAIGTIAVDGTVTVTFRSKVGSVKSGTRISNQAVAYADQSNPKRSSTAAGTVDDPTTVVVRTSGDELWTLLLVLLLLAFAAGLALPRPKVAWGRRVLRNSAVLLVLAALLSGGLEIAAANGFDVPTPSGVLASIMAPAASRVSVPAKSVKAAATVNRVSIPSIHLDIKLVEGKDMGVLARGLWHQPPSVVPGERGASVIAGHRIAGQFINLHLLHKGDRVTVTYGGRAHVYRVSSVQDVASTSATASFRVGSVEKLILYTCTPRWQGNRRTIVTCLPVK